MMWPLPFSLPAFQQHKPIGGPEAKSPLIFAPMIICHVTIETLMALLSVSMSPGEWDPDTEPVLREEGMDVA